MSYNIKNSSCKVIPGIGYYLKERSHFTSFHGNFHKSYNIHNGGYYKDPKVHRSKRVTFSMQSSTGQGQEIKLDGQSYGRHLVSRDHSIKKNTGLFSINEKETMQHLNQRLSTYLEKVNSLEQENADLERKICEWHENNAPKSLPDSSHYFRTIQELQNQVSSTTLQNARIFNHISNAKLATDDLGTKYEMEHNLRSSVEADIALLRRVLKELNKQKQYLETEVQCLQEDIIQIDNQHEEEVSYLQSQLGSRVNVALNAAPSVDLTQALSEIQEQYENLMARNLKEVESIFLNRSAELNSEMPSGTMQIVSFKNEVVNLKHSVQTLEIELKSQLKLKSALEGTLMEVQDTYGSQLARIQGLIDNLEKQMSQIQSDLNRHISNYQQLMDHKSLLKMEIATYKQLLDGPDAKFSSLYISLNKDGTLSNGYSQLIKVTTVRSVRVLLIYKYCCYTMVLQVRCPQKIDQDERLPQR
ncbi:keratin, type I cytoskeletal 19-like [Hyla sarda]|uniref:keratin, type I cytoskeletal 19-like n=1 Tax=Hyla sarda TaxID=327740 RepID=UPI0024C2BA75|nr:keratin, type I cytoskeletal 19-like [Hyla sarda]